MLNFSFLLCLFPGVESWCDPEVCPYLGQEGVQRENSGRWFRVASRKNSPFGTFKNFCLKIGVLWQKGVMI